VIYDIMYTASSKPLAERVNFKLLDQDIKSELENNGITIPYHFIVETADGREVYRCPDFEEDGEEYTYSQVLYRNDPQAKRGVVKIHFPAMTSYIMSSVTFMIPSLIFTIVLMVTFIFTIVVIFRQKKLSEIKNDFINNMTHEFKTPISTISLAAQMLGDESVAKSPTMFKHLSTVIVNETKRLRFQVEKVLQMSMFDRQKTLLKEKEMDINQLIDGVINTFALKVEQHDGSIDSELKAEDPMALVDEMHFTNVIFNLMDNAVKFTPEGGCIRVSVEPVNPDDGASDVVSRSGEAPGEHHLSVSILNTGSEIPSESLDRIFQKFYKADPSHSGEGNGIGLALVKRVIDLHGGTVTVQSHDSTTFTVKM